jgi:hypothetical protein
MQIGNHDAPTESRLLAKLLRGLLAREQFATLADLTAALKTECARLRIRWTNDAISDAYRVIDSNTPLLSLGRRSRVSHERVERVEEARPPSRADAEAILARVYAGLARHEAGGRDVHR